MRHLSYHTWCPPADTSPNSHTDHGTTTLLFSVPISCLQIWGRDEKWHYVRYEPGALVVNIGETLESKSRHIDFKPRSMANWHGPVLSGGHFKATRHRGSFNLFSRSVSVANS